MSKIIRYSDFIKDLNKSFQNTLIGEEATYINIKTYQLHSAFRGLKRKPILKFINNKWIIIK